MAGESVVEFDTAVQKLEALNSAAYRMTAVATCEISLKSERYVCRLKALGGQTPDAIRIRFLQTVTDENTRADLRVRTDPTRNLILSLAFGALAAEGDGKAGA